MASTTITTIQLKYGSNSRDFTDHRLMWDRFTSIDASDRSERLAICYARRSFRERPATRVGSGDKSEARKDCREEN